MADIGEDAKTWSETALAASTWTLLIFSEKGPPWLLQLLLSSFVVVVLLAFPFSKAENGGLSRVGAPEAGEPGLSVTRSWM